jgi:hypothetical protein
MKNEKEESIISAKYDIARTYSLKWDSENAIFYLKQVLNWENASYYIWFLKEFSRENYWPFKLIKDNENFKAFFSEITNLYINIK